MFQPEFKVVIFLNKSVTIYNFADTLSQTGNRLNQLHVDKLANFSFKSKLAVGLRQYDSHTLSAEPQHLVTLQ